MKHKNMKSSMHMQKSEAKHAHTEVKHTSISEIFKLYFFRLLISSEYIVFGSVIYTECNFVKKFIRDLKRLTLLILFAL